MSLLRPDRVTIIAEIGSNHNGDIDMAYRLIDMAAEAGADVCKFQSFLVDELLSATDPNFERLKALELPRSWYPKLMERCAKKGVVFLSTATNFTTLGWMEELGVAGYKVASGNITHRPLLDRLIALNKGVVVSTGMATLDEITDLARHFVAGGLDEFAFLHCVAEYPAPAANMKLRNIPMLRELLSCPVGFSDHSAGSHLAVAAVALGARIVEKHVSWDKTGIGMDHEVAILPNEFAALCSGVRDTEAALKLDFTPDWRTIKTMRRALRFARPMRAGEVVTADDLKVTRPEDGLQPEHLTALVGRRLAVDVAADQPTRWEQFV